MASVSKQLKSVSSLSSVLPPSLLPDLLWYKNVHDTDFIISAGDLCTCRFCSCRAGILLHMQLQPYSTQECFNKEMGAFPQKLEISILNLLTQPLSLASPAQHHCMLAVIVLSMNSGSCSLFKPTCMADGKGWEKIQPHKACLADSAQWGSGASCKQTC